MAAEHAAYLFAIAVGIVSSGLVGAVWALASGEEPRLGCILDPNPGLLTPLRVLAVVFAAPTTVLIEAFWWMIAQPLVGIPLLAAGLLWSFLQGVFILTQFFGFI